METIYEKNKVEIVRVTPNLYYRRGDMPERRQCNQAYVVSGDIVAAVDVTTMEAAKEMTEEAAALFGHPIRHIFMTHGDGDHVQGLPFFIDKPVNIFGSHRLLAQIVPEGYAGPATFIGVEGVLRLRMGELEVELEAVQGAAHSPRDLFIRILRDECVCVGDAGVALPHLYFHNADAENWANVLREMHARGGKYILPGHGDIYPYSHLLQVADFIDVLVRAGHSCLDALPFGEAATLEANEIDSMVVLFLTGDSADAQTIRQTVGSEAERQLRMVIQSLVRKARAERA